MSDPNTLPVRYTELSKTKTMEAVDVAVARAVADLDKAGHAAENIGQLNIVVVNRLRSAGQNFHLAAGLRQQLDFGPGVGWVREQIVPRLQDKYRIEHVKVCCRVADILPEPVATVAEARKVLDEIQLMLAFWGLVETRPPRPAQVAHLHNVFARLVTQCAAVDNLFEDIEQERPMANWSVDELDQFLLAAEPVKEKIVYAERLRIAAAQGKE